jgi:hypothetical protein
MGTAWIVLNVHDYNVGGRKSNSTRAHAQSASRAGVRGSCAVILIEHFPEADFNARGI